jgi:hypothetical protein
MIEGFDNPSIHKGVNRESGGPLRVRQKCQTIPIPQNLLGVLDWGLTYPL